LYSGSAVSVTEPGQRRCELPQGALRQRGAEAVLQLVVERRSGLGEHASALFGQLEQ
jgi:hypothetical protein